MCGVAQRKSGRLPNLHMRRFDSGPAHKNCRKEAYSVKFVRDLVLFCTVFCGGGYGLIFCCARLAQILDAILA